MFEKPIKVFGRKRVVAAPRRYERSLSRGAIIPYKPTHDEEYAHLGPGTYTPHKDIWRDHERHVCGMKQESRVFKSPGRYELPPGIGLGLGSALENDDSITRKTVKEQSSLCRPLTSQKRAVATFTHTPTNIKNISLVSEDNIRGTHMNDANPFEIGWHNDSFADGSISFTSPIRAQSASISSRSLKSAERLMVAKKSREPGFKFLAGKMGPSAMDIVTGTTNADLHYRRIKSYDGELKIVPFYGKELSIPKNSILIETWATSQEVAEKDENLQVRMEAYGSPQGIDNDNNKSVDNVINRNSHDNINQNDDHTYISTADYSQELRYSEELSSSILDGRLSSLQLNDNNNNNNNNRARSPTTPIQRSLPSSATLERPLRNYEKEEWKRPMTVSRADEKMKLLQRKHLTEIRKKNNNYTDMKWNHTNNNYNSNNELLVPIRVADSMPIKTNTTKKILVKTIARGGGDVLGGSRGRSRDKLHNFSFLTENSNLLTEGFI